MKHALLCIAILSAGAAFAGDSAVPDHGFYTKAAQGGMAEVEAGKLAQSKGSSQAVKDFAAMMVKDHSKANEKLKSIAAQKTITLPAETDAKHKMMKHKLEAASGAGFDKQYLAGQVADHEATQTLLQHEIDSGKDADAKAFANEILPTVTAHLKKVRELAADAGVEAHKVSMDTDRKTY